MHKAQFLAIIEEAHKLLVAPYVYSWCDDKPQKYLNGVCCALDEAAYRMEVPMEWNNLFRPENKSGYWFGARSEYNLQTRQIGLDLFKELCLANKIYKEF